MFAGVAITSLALTAAPTGARISVSEPARTYVQARAASMNGDHSQAAELLASLSANQPDQPELATRALAEAMGAGQMSLAISLASKIPAAQLPGDARLLMAAEEIRRRRPDRANAWLNTTRENGDLTFLVPLVNAWAAADRNDAAGALASLDQITGGNLLVPLAAEERALILLRFKRTAEAEPYARAAVGRGGAREDRLRLAFADGFLAAGDRQRALMIVEGMGAGETAARARINAGRNGGQAIDNLAKAYGEVLAAFGADLVRLQRGSPPIGLVQVARYINPRSSSTTALLAVLLGGQGRSDEALALLRAVPADDPLISQIRDVQTRLLTDNKRYDEAYRIAAAAAGAPGAEAIDFSRLGDVLQAMDRHGPAADAYGRAIALTQQGTGQSALWTLLLLKAGALEDGNRWPEARAALQQALAIAPDQPLLLNFMGYGQLERGENLDSAEAMIRKASELAPDDASIADSLGWAQFKRGKTDEAIVTLQKAAEKDPVQAEIQEHLGDALYKSGRRVEARYAWNAALVTAEDDVATRVKAKLAGGLTTANAAP